MPDPIDVQVGNRTRLFRKLRGVSQSELGSRIGVSFQQIQKYEKGTNRVAPSRLRVISDVLETPIAHFFDDNALVGTEEANPVATDRDLLDLVAAYVRIANPDRGKVIMSLIESLGD